LIARAGRDAACMPWWPLLAACCWRLAATRATQSCWPKRAAARRPACWTAPQGTHPH
jgi:hypothetical protein